MSRTRAPQNPGEALTADTTDAATELDAIDTTPASAKAGESEVEAAQRTADARGRAVFVAGHGWICPTPKLQQPVR